jgi:hypothetical protein
MKKNLLTSVAFVFLAATASFAAMPSLDLDPTVSTNVEHDYLVLAKKGSDDGGDDNSGDDNGGDRDDDDSDDADDDSDDDSTQSNSNRRKPRIPGGSGCDGAGDAAEHASCSPQ